jgi:hypothetical protein
MAAAELDADPLAAYAARLENTILIVADALRAGDVGYAQRVLDLIEARIRSNIVEAEAEGRTVH